MKKEIDNMNKLISDSLNSCKLTFKLPDELINKNIMVTELKLSNIKYNEKWEMIENDFEARVCEVDKIN